MTEHPDPQTEPTSSDADDRLSETAGFESAHEASGVDGRIVAVALAALALVLVLGMLLLHSD